VAEIGVFPDHTLILGGVGDRVAVGDPLRDGHVEVRGQLRELVAHVGEVDDKAAKPVRQGVRLEVRELGRDRDDRDVGRELTAAGAIEEDEIGVDGNVGDRRRSCMYTPAA
jgi:hypothetical protein